MTRTIDRDRLATLRADEERRFVETHPRSAALAERARGPLLAGVPNALDDPVAGADVDRHTEVFGDAVGPQWASVGRS